MPPRFAMFVICHATTEPGLSRHRYSRPGLAGSDRLRSRAMALPGDTPEQLAGIISKLLTDLVARNDQVRSHTQHATMAQLRPHLIDRQRCNLVWKILTERRV